MSLAAAFARLQVTFAASIVFLLCIHLSETSLRASLLSAELLASPTVSVRKTTSFKPLVVPFLFFYLHRRQRRTLIVLLPRTPLLFSDDVSVQVIWKLVSGLQLQSATREFPVHKLEVLRGV